MHSCEFFHTIVLLALTLYAKYSQESLIYIIHFLNSLVILVDLNNIKYH